MGTPSKLRVIRKATDLVRVRPTLDLRCEEKTTRTIADIQENYLYHQGNVPRSEGRQFRKVDNIPTMTTPVFNHLVCFHFVCCAKNFIELVNHPVRGTFWHQSEWYKYKRWSLRTSSWNFLEPQATRGFSEMTGIWSSMVMSKKAYERLVDQVSSLPYLYDESWSSSLLWIEKTRVKDKTSVPVNSSV